MVMFQKKRQKCSAHNSLVKMISKILEGGKLSHELSADIQKVSVNLSQLISLKSVKQKRREGTQKFCHPKKQ